MAARNRVTVNLEDEEYEALVDVATRTDRSIAWVGRQAIVEFLASQERKEVPSLRPPERAVHSLESRKDEVSVVRTFGTTRGVD